MLEPVLLLTLWQPRCAHHLLVCENAGCEACDSRSIEEVSYTLGSSAVRKCELSAIMRYGPRLSGHIFLHAVVAIMSEMPDFVLDIWVYQ